MLSIGPVILYGLLLLQSAFYNITRPRRFLNSIFYIISIVSLFGVINSVLAYLLLQNSIATKELNGIQVAYAFYYLTITFCWLAAINMYHRIASSEQNKWNYKNIFGAVYVWVCIQTIITIVIFAALFNTNAFPKLVIFNVCLLWPYPIITGYLYLKYRRLVTTSSIKILHIAFLDLNAVALAYNSALCFTYSSTEAVLHTSYPVFFVIDFLQFITLALANIFCVDLPLVANSQMMSDSGPGYVLGTENAINAVF